MTGSRHGGRSWNAFVLIILVISPLGVVSVTFVKLLQVGGIEAAMLMVLSVVCSVACALHVWRRVASSRTLRCDQPAPKDETG